MEVRHHSTFDAATCRDAVIATWIKERRLDIILSFLSVTIYVMGNVFSRLIFSHTHTHARARARTRTHARTHTHRAKSDYLLFCGWQERVVKF
jgi:hypothetical protein